MKLIAAVALASGFVAAPMMAATTAAASPGYCDGAECVPYVDRTAVEGTHCVQNTRYNFGIDASGNTLACNSRSTWIASPPLVGIRTLRLPCGEDTGVAQSPDGVPLSCIDGAWTADYRVTFYG
ncbi:hypothetical protein [Mycobacterium deserti]|uniref:Secreted protein n=1 Tax=Mycobacterium deserti TaxID=2978347 RepID=A0ABT2MHB8_9MYCO|nr:hypothetical protein [Mycobacterium deserti]MCT7661647.1 hypothetical protein [Mycobacterium deserti]